jgi:Pentapeptide repeats (8 copies)
MTLRRYGLIVGVVLAALFPCGVVAISGSGAAFAQPAAQAPGRESLELRKLATEIDKLSVEVEELRYRQTPIGRLSGFAGVFAAAVAAFGAALVTVLAYVFDVLGRRKSLKQERYLARETHKMSLVAQLGHRVLAARIAAAELLFGMIREPQRGRGGRRTDLTPDQQRELLRALIGVAKDDKPHPVLVKLIGDNLVRLLGAIVPAGRTPSSRSQSPLRNFEGEALDLQKVKFPDVYWRRVDARNVDFFGADFTDASLREAFLHGTIFFKATLKKAVLRDADLTGANLQGADLAGADLTGADLRGANLKGAILTDANLDDVKYDAKSVWPEGFTPPPSAA